MTLVLGIDIGGTGSRAALGEVDDAGSAPRIIDQLTGTRIEIGSSSGTVLDVVRELVRSAAETWPDRFSEVSGIGIGATGIASLAEDPSAVLAEISAEHGVPAVVAIDAVTAHTSAPRRQDRWGDHSARNRGHCHRSSGAGRIRQLDIGLVASRRLGASLR